MKRRKEYTGHERRVLLTGVPLSPASTRFGHPFNNGWNIAEIRAAWDQLKSELLAEWQSRHFERYRKRHGHPFAERLLLEQGAADD